MGKALVALIGGLLFGLGLGVSGVANPVVINNYLDLAGPNLDWTLLILFVSAVVFTTMAYQGVLRWRSRPLFDTRFHLPDKTRIDARLVGGAVIFGFGWSLSGYCVGPALAVLVRGYATALPYLGGIALGVFAYSAAGGDKEC
jgi:uncharacterized membrane protein YedE/YeeE